MLYVIENETLYERFSFKSIRKTNILAKLIKNDFEWNTNMSRNIFDRRGNFENITLFGMFEPWTNFNKLSANFQKNAKVSKIIPNTHEVIKS